MTLRDSMRAFPVVAMGMGLLAPIARQTPALARPVIWALAAGYAAVTIISALYFVTAPIVVAAAITLSLVAAAVTRQQPE